MAKIANKINELTGNDEQTQKMKEQFAFLQKMAQAKTSQFEAEIKESLANGSKESCEIVGDRAVAYYASQHIDIKVGCDGAIRSAIDSFFQGKSGIKDGFQKLVTCAISTIIGDSTMGEYEDKMFFIYPENNAIIRVDVKVYKYTFSQKGLVADCENLFCYTMAKSIVDHTKLSKDELLYFITQMCKGNGEESVDIKTVMDFVKELITIWNLLDQEVLQPNRRAANLQITPEQVEECNTAEGALTVEDAVNHFNQN